MGTSFRANLALVCGETVKQRACQKVPTDRQHFVFIYVVDSFVRMNIRAGRFSFISIKFTHYTLYI